MTEPSQSWLDWALSTAGNAGRHVLNGVESIPSSAVVQAKNIGHAIAHPIDTLRGAHDAIQGAQMNALDKVLPRSVVDRLAAPMMGTRPGTFQRQRDAAGAVGHAYAQRYGGLGAAGHTLETDPVGAAMDASMLFGGGAGIAGKLAPLSTTARVLRTAADVTNPAHLALMAAAKIPGASKAGALVARPFRKLSDVVGKDGALTEPAIAAITQSGIPPHLFGDPGLTATFQRLAETKGVSPATAREALLTHTGAPTVTRGTAVGQRPPKAAEGVANAALDEARAGVSHSRAAAAPDVSNAAGHDFTENYLNAHTARNQAYQNLAKNTGVFHPDTVETFHPTLEQTLTSPEHSTLPGKLEDIQGRTDMPNTKALLFGGRGGSSLTDKLSNLAERTKDLDLTDGTHSRQTAPGTLTVSEIEGLRQEINSAYRDAGPQDRAGLNFLSDALGKWADEHATKGNFTGDGAQVLADAKAAREAHKNLVTTYDKNPLAGVRNAANAIDEHLDVAPDGVASLAKTAPTELPTTVQQKLVGSVVKPGAVDTVRATPGGKAPAGEQALQQLTDQGVPLPLLSDTGVESLHGALRAPAFSGALSTPDLHAALNGPIGHLFTPEENMVLQQHAAARDLLDTPAKNLPASDLDAEHHWTRRFGVPLAGSAVGSGVGGAAAHLFPMLPGNYLVGAGAGIGGTLAGAAEQLASGREAVARTGKEMAGAPTTYQTGPVGRALAATGNVAVDAAPALHVADTVANPPADQPAPQPTGPKTFAPDQLANDFAQPGDMTKPEGPERDKPTAQPTLSPDALANDFEKPGDLGKDKPEQRATGGRLARKSGGKIDHKHVDKLVRRLLHKAERVRKHTSTHTEALLQHGDDAIVSALNVAKQGI